MALKDLKEQAKDLLRTKSRKLEAREERNEAYRVIGEELAAGKKDMGAWTKALADSAGDERAAEVLYIERMVELKELRDLRDRKDISRAIKEEEKRKEEEELSEREKFLGAPFWCCSLNSRLYCYLGPSFK